MKVYFINNWRSIRIHESIVMIGFRWGCLNYHPDKKFFRLSIMNFVIEIHYE